MAGGGKRLFPRVCARKPGRRLMALALAGMLMPGAFAPTPSVAAVELHRFSVGGWALSAFGDGSGRVDGCAASTSYRSGVTLVFVLLRNEVWALTLAGPPVKVIRNRNVELPVALKVDGLPPRVLTGELDRSDAGALRIVLPADDDMFNALRQGRTLYVTTSDRHWMFDLKDTYAMLTALYRCATSGTSGVPDAPIVSSDGPAGGRPEPQGESHVPASAHDAPPASPGTVSTGSGFFIRVDGVGLTNAHVVRGCSAATISGHGAADIVARDTANDLAVVRLRSPRATVAAEFRRTAVQLGESVYVLGFPLAGELDNGLNFTSGLVSSLAGAGNDTRQLQLTAPIQLGNSGGPIVDKAGAVVGVTQSKFNDLVALQQNGSVPQNLNFGIKASLATDFLRSSGFNPVEGDARPGLEATEIAKLGREFTFQISCKPN